MRAVFRSQFSSAGAVFGPAFIEAGFIDTENPVLVGPITVSLITNESFVTTCPEGTDNVSVAAYEVRENGGAWINKGMSRTHTHLGKTTLTSYDVEWSCLDPSGRRSNLLFLEVTTYPNGATGQQILENAGPVGDNLGGFVWNDIQPGDENAYFWFEITTPLSFGVFIELNPDSTFVYEGPPDTFRYNLYRNGVLVEGSPATVTLFGSVDRRRIILIS